MFCKFVWNREFLDDILTENFRTKVLRAHRENVLCEREKSRLPETQALLQTVTERLNSLTEDDKCLAEDCTTLQCELFKITTEYQNRIENINRLLRQKRRQITHLRSVLQGYTDTIPNDDDLMKDAVKKISQISMPCPANDCRGFVGATYVCDICHTKVCKACHVVVGDADHACKEEDVATVKQLKKDSKSCPGCSVRIYKIDGCDQMWCTACRTPFSWKTGQKIEGGQIHNPHFYEWRRNNGGLAAGAVDINGCPVDITDILSMEGNISRVVGLHRIRSRVLSEIHREIVEITDFHLNRRPNAMADPNRELRIDYLTGKITEMEWKQELQKREKREMRNFEVRQVLQMYADTTKDMFREIVTAQTTEALDEIQRNMISLQKYVFGSLCKVNQRYGSTAVPVYARFAERLEKMKSFMV
jgi:hypothetical protein